MSDILNDRKLKILQAVVDDYIMTGVPVGSRTISKKYLEWSSATIRNEMMDLEELGYLAQPHTSAGRVPSERAYRLYVEQLMNVSELNEVEIENLQKHLNRRSRDLKQLYHDAARAISDATSYTAFVMPPNPLGVKIRNIQLVPVTQGLALLVLITDVGIFKDTFIRVSPDFTQDDLYRISSMLQQDLNGHSLNGVLTRLEGQMRDSIDDQRQIMEAILDSIKMQMRDECVNDIVVGGSSNILKHPEYADAEKARSLLSAMESSETLGSMLQGARGLQFTVTIGNENRFDVMKDCSVVTVSYQVDGVPTGSMGVIGPTRMNYSHVTSVLNYMKEMVSEILAGSIDEPVRNLSEKNKERKE